MSDGMSELERGTYWSDKGRPIRFKDEKEGAPMSDLRERLAAAFKNADGPRYHEKRADALLAAMREVAREAALEATVETLRQKILASVPEPEQMVREFDAFARSPDPLDDFQQARWEVYHRPGELVAMFLAARQRPTEEGR